MATKTIIIPPVERQWIEVRVRGSAPLICHRYSERAQDAMAKAQQGAAKSKKPPREPEREFQDAQYRLPDGRHGFPAIGIKRAMVSAGQRFAAERSTELFGAFTIVGELLPIESPREPSMRTDRVVIGGASRTTSLAYRPQYDPWEMVIPLVVNVSFVSVDQIINLLTLAGFSVGIGDWRPERKGPFGTWEIVDMRQIEQRAA